MMPPKSINMYLYISLVWAATCVVCLMKYSHYRRYSDKIVVTNTTSEWVSDLSCVVSTLMEKTQKTSETIQCLANRGDHAERSLWEVVHRRKIIHPTDNRASGQKNRRPPKIPEPTTQTVTERHYRNSSFILVFDIGNRIVYKLKEGPNQRHVKYVYPETDVLVDIEYSTKERKLLWASQRRIVTTPLKSNLSERDTSHCVWRGKYALLKVRRDSRQTVLFTSRNIYKSSFHYTSSSRKKAIASISHPYHVELDERRGHIYWVEQRTEMARLKMVSYSGGLIRTIHSVETMDSFTVTGGAYYLYYCGPMPRIALLHNLKQDKALTTVSDDCIGVAGGYQEKHILTSSTLVTLPRKGQSFLHSFPTIETGGVKYIE